MCKGQGFEVVWKCGDHSGGVAKGNEEVGVAKAVITVGRGWEGLPRQHGNVGV